MEKKIVVPCLEIKIMIAFFPRNIHLSSFVARKARLNTEQVPPGHPIILRKSNEFNMAAASVKRSINYDRWDDLPRRLPGLPGRILDGVNFCHVTVSRWSGFVWH